MVEFKLFKTDIDNLFKGLMVFVNLLLNIDMLWDKTTSGRLAMVLHAENVYNNVKYNKLEFKTKR